MAAFTRTIQVPWRQEMMPLGNFSPVNVTQNFLRALEIRTLSKQKAAPGAGRHVRCRSLTMDQFPSGERLLQFPCSLDRTLYSWWGYNIRPRCMWGRTVRNSCATTRMQVANIKTWTNTWSDVVSWQFLAAAPEDRTRSSCPSSSMDPTQMWLLFTIQNRSFSVPVS